MKNAAASDWRTFLICIGLIALVFTVFGQTIRFGFVNYDDDSRVYANPIVLHGLTWDGITTYFSLHHPRPDYWHPLTFLTHMADCQLYGTWAGGHHLTNVLLHAVVVILFFLLLRSMTGAFWRSAAAAALYAIHPLRVESVAWISERKDMLSGIFFLLTLAAYLRYGRRPTPGGYLAVAALFALGLMSKPTLMPLPLLLLALDYWPLARHRVADSAGNFLRVLPRLIFEKFPLLVMSAFSCIEASIANATAFISGSHYSFSLRLENVLVSYASYFWMTFWPSSLCMYYPFPEHGISIYKVYGALLFLVVIFSTGIKLYKNEPALLISLIWYIIMLLPMIGIIQAGSIERADRYTYIPMMGGTIFIVWLGVFINRKIQNFMPIKILVILTILLLAFLSYRLTRNWKDSISINLRALQCTQGTDLVHNNLGNGFLEIGKKEQAEKEFREAIIIHPDYLEAHVSLGYVLSSEGRLKEAIQEDIKSIKIDPENFRAHNNLANALFQEGDINGALGEYKQALRICPDYASGHYNLGILLCNQKKYIEGISEFRKTLKINPKHIKAHIYIGESLEMLGMINEAILEFFSILKENPNSLDTLIDLEKLLYSNGERGRVIELLNNSTATLSENLFLLNDFSWILSTAPESRLRDGPRALELARKAVEMSGGTDPIMLDTLAAAFAETRDYPKALETAHKALELAAKAGNRELAESLRKEIHLYESGQPLRAPLTNP